jgi:hypothetical protein
VFLHHTAPEHAGIVARAVIGGCRGAGWRSPVQPRLLHVLFNQLYACEVDFGTAAPLAPAEVAEALRSPEERSELIQLMCAMEILCNPVPPESEASVAGWARALGVAEPSLSYLRDLARGEAAKAMEDFYRLNWIGDLDRRRPGFDALLARTGPAAWARTLEADPALAARWSGVGRCPAGSIGRHLFEFYEKRGFLFPGQLGAANESVARHDWIHLLADYGTTPLGEIEVVSFQSTCSRTPGALLGLVGALALFESGVMPKGLVTGAYPQQGLSKPGGSERMAEAIRRGRSCNTDLLLDVDYFEIASEPLEALRERFAIPPKTPATRALDPWGALELPPDGPNRRS